MNLSVRLPARHRPGRCRVAPSCNHVGPLGHGADVGQFGAGQHRPATSPLPGPGTQVCRGHRRQLPVGEHRPLGGAGRAGGEHDGHHPLAIVGPVEHGGCLAGTGQLHQHGRRADGRLDHHQLRADDGEHCRSLDGRGAGVDAGGDSTQLGQRGVGHQVVGRRREDEGDQVPIADVMVDGQPCCHLVAAAVQLGEGERPPVGRHHRRPIAEAPSRGAHRRCDRHRSTPGTG